MNGILNIFKTSGMTSHDVVYKVRKILKTKKVGHTGTLDPMAQGVLPVCIGAATKISQFIVEKQKEYIAELTLGLKTDTYDNTGQITKKSSIIIEKEDFERVLPSFIGDIKQIPPIYSAIKVDGKKLYEYARENKEVEIKERDVNISKLQLLDYTFPVAKIKIACSKGTYIRSLCNDIGEKLGSYGMMSSLIRTKSGPFYLETAISLEDLSMLSIKEVENKLYPIDFPLKHLKKVDVQLYSAKYLLNGNSLIQKNIIQDLSEFSIDERIRLHLDGEFRGIGQIRKEESYYYVKPIRLFL